MSEANDAEKDGEVKERDAESSEATGGAAAPPEAGATASLRRARPLRSPFAKKEEEEKEEARRRRGSRVGVAQEGGTRVRRERRRARGLPRVVPRRSRARSAGARFEVGNYAYVREHAGKLAEKSEDEKVRAAARELLARIEADPLMKFLLLGAVALLVFLTLYAYQSHAH